MYKNLLCLPWATKMTFTQMSVNRVGLGFHEYLIQGAQAGFEAHGNLLYSAEPQQRSLAWCQVSKEWSRTVCKTSRANLGC